MPRPLHLFVRRPVIGPRGSGSHRRTHPPRMDRSRSAPQLMQRPCSRMAVIPRPAGASRRSIQSLVFESHPSSNTASMIPVTIVDGTRYSATPSARHAGHELVASRRRSSTRMIISTRAPALGHRPSHGPGSVRRTLSSAARLRRLRRPRPLQLIVLRHRACSWLTRDLRQNRPNAASRAAVCHAGIQTRAASTTAHILHFQPASERTAHTHATRVAAPAQRRG